MYLSTVQIIPEERKAFSRFLGLMFGSAQRPKLSGFGPLLELESNRNRSWVEVRCGAELGGVFQLAH